MLRWYMDKIETEIETVIRNYINLSVLKVDLYSIIQQDLPLSKCDLSQKLFLVLHEAKYATDKILFLKKKIWKKKYIIFREY